MLLIVKSLIVINIKPDNEATAVAYKTNKYVSEIPQHT